MKSIIVVILVVLNPFFLVFSQDNLDAYLNNSASSKDTVPVYATFKASKIINAKSNESVHKGELEVIVSHRFGDIGGHNGGAQTFFGTDNSSDIKIGLDYGITNRLSVGLARAKGATAIRELVETSFKCKLLQQTERDRIPFGITLFGNAVVTAMGSNVNEKVPDHFDNFSDRLSFVGQVIFTRKFNRNFSLAILPTVSHYNRTGFGDSNDIFAIGAGARVKLTKRMSFIADYFYTFNSKNRKEYFEKNGLPFYNPLGVGLEIETGGHVFQITFMNSTALLENQFIPYTTSDWTKGQFRWGFSITRPFSLAKKKTNKKL
jgi:predicted porin